MPKKHYLLSSNVFANSFWVLDVHFGAYSHSISNLIYMVNPNYKICNRSFEVHMWFVLQISYLSFYLSFTYLFARMSMHTRARSCTVHLYSVFWLSYWLPTSIVQFETCHSQCFTQMVGQCEICVIFPVSFQGYPTGVSRIKDLQSYSLGNMIA